MPERSTLLNIPPPADAITLKNVAIGSALTALLLVLVALPSTLFNSTLEANLDEVRAWFPWSRRVAARAVTAAPGTRPSFWPTWPGFVVYAGAAGLLYSRMQPGWGWNRGTAQTFIGFGAGIAVSTFSGIVITRRYLRRAYDEEVGGHIEVAIGTLALAAVCVVASRVADFEPGYFYGVLAAYVATRHPTRDDSAVISLRAVGLTYVLAVGGWLLLGPLDHLATGTSVLAPIPRSLAGGMVTGGVEAILIGMTPLRFLPGFALREWNPRIWLAAYAGGGFLFSLVLLHPGLVGAHTSSVVATLVLAGGFGLGSILFWAYFRRLAIVRERAADVALAPTPEDVPVH